MNGVQHRSEEVIIIGTTDRPKDLDTAVLWRMPLHIHVSLPEMEDRKAIVIEWLQSEEHPLEEDDFAEIAEMT